MKTVPRDQQLDQAVERIVQRDAEPFRQQHLYRNSNCTKITFPFVQALLADHPGITVRQCFFGRLHPRLFVNGSL
jgi:hypothetical protein